MSQACVSSGFWSVGVAPPVLSAPRRDRSLPAQRNAAAPRPQHCHAPASACRDESARSRPHVPDSHFSTSHHAARRYASRTQSHGDSDSLRSSGDRGSRASMRVNRKRLRLARIDGQQKIACRTLPASRGGASVTHATIGHCCEESDRGSLPALFEPPNTTCRSSGQLCFSSYRMVGSDHCAAQSGEENV
jgi:hypothetical protein